MRAGRTMGGDIRIRLRPTGLLLAEGPLGWGITLFEGNLGLKEVLADEPVQTKLHARDMYL